MGVIARDEGTQQCIPTLPDNVQDKVVSLLALDLDLEQAGAVRSPPPPPLPHSSIFSRETLYGVPEVQLCGQSESWQDESLCGQDEARRRVRDCEAWMF